MRSFAPIAAELAIPSLFSLGDIEAGVERLSGRVTHVLTADLGSGSPSVIWFRKDGEDYLFCEKRTSPFHQAYIAVHLAAHALQLDADGTALDARLWSALGPELPRLMLGHFNADQVSDVEADSFAFLAMPLRESLAKIKVRQSLRRLEPLRSALLGAVPQARRSLSGLVRPSRGASSVPDGAGDPRRRTGAAGAHRDPEVAAVAEADELASADRPVAVEAAVLAHAVRASKTGRPACPKPDGLDSWSMAETDLASEVASLLRLSRDFVSRSTPRQD